MLRRILCVDDDQRILEAFERQYRKDFEIETALGPDLGLQALRTKGPFAVVVSDLRMPLMDGIEFLGRVRQSSPDTVRIMLTGNADLSAAISAVNDGHIFQFLTKPCPSTTLTRTLESALEQYRLVTSERELLEHTLNGAVGVMSEILSLVNPPAFSRAQRIGRYVRHMAQKLKFAETWQFELAAMLSQVGCVAVPPNILEKSHWGGPLDTSEREILASQNQIARNLLAKIPRLEDVANMVAQQSLPWPGAAGASENVKTGAHLLKIALDLDEQVMRGNTLDSVIEQMRRNRQYHTAFVNALQQLQVEQTRSQTQLLSLGQLQPHMIVNSGIYSKTGLLLLAKGQEVTESAIARLESFASLFGIVEPISVVVPHSAQSLHTVAA